MKNDLELIERQIVIGLIVSTDYLQEFTQIYQSNLIESSTAKKIIGWCITYFEKYKKAPFKNIENIYLVELKEGRIQEEFADEFENDILPDLNDEYVHGSFNIQYLIDNTYKRFQIKHLQNYNAEIEELIQKGELIEAQNFANNYKAISKEIGADINLESKSAYHKIEQAFNIDSAPLIKYPGVLGNFWNHQLLRDSFVALMGPEKRGKTFLLIDIAVRAVKQKSNVVFFQAGDMSEDQQLRRIGIKLAKKSNMMRYCGDFFIPVKDCKLNQLDKCDKQVRECDFGIFDNLNEEELKEITQEQLIEQYNENLAYTPCHNCKEYKENKNLGTPWVIQQSIGVPLTGKEAAKKVRTYFKKYKKTFKLSTHANGTLTVKKIKDLLSIWEKNENFIPDVIVIDYADLLITSNNTEFRHQQNQIWKDLRGLSQEKHCLLVTATQANAKSYEQDTLSLNNFSEDKRKYAHVTAMYGLNQDKKGREKAIGLMRVNEIVIREGESNVQNQVTILQSLRMGQAFLSSF